METKLQFGEVHYNPSLGIKSDELTIEIDSIYIYKDSSVDISISVDGLDIFGVDEVLDKMLNQRVDEVLDKMLNQFKPFLAIKETGETDQAQMLARCTLKKDVPHALFARLMNEYGIDTKLVD